MTSYPENSIILFQNIMKNKNIPFIHNYCDRWCERCAFTSRCAVGESESKLKPEEKDIDNKAFWDNLSKNFAEGLLLLKKAAKEHGLDLDNLPPEEIAEIDKQHKKNRIESKNHPISRLSWDYSEAARTWLETMPGLEEKKEELLTGINLGLQTEADVNELALEVRENISVINWYVFFIHVKFMRALTGKWEDDNWEEENGYQRDFDGSAKIAMIAVDRTIQAWLKLFQLMPDREDQFFPLLAQLQKIKTIAEKEFPKAQKFIRPGFDEVDKKVDGRQMN